MTCRINRRVIGDYLVILCISGRIAKQDVDMLQDLLKQEKSAVAIDLKDVFLVDREAVKFLALCESNGAELRNCPAYIREWVTRERVDKSGSEQRIEGNEGIENA
jgi:predicted metal-binding protein